MRARKYDRKDWVISPPEEIHPLLGGDGGWRLASVLAPPASDIREMLFDLRKRLGWSQSFAAAIMGVSKNAIVKWEAGDRAIHGAAAKLIFLLHSQFVENLGKIQNAWDLAYWGRFPCRGSIKEAFVLGATFFVSERVALRYLSDDGHQAPAAGQQEPQNQNSSKQS